MPSPVLMVEDNAILKSGGNGLWELVGNNCENGCSQTEGGGNHWLANGDALLVEMFLLPLCLDKTLELIFTKDVCLDQMKKGHLVALFTQNQEQQQQQQQHTLWNLQQQQQQHKLCVR